jgi:lipopolysaccharide/colanic/teichoic acid biosynthesis glycosyltransferase
VKRLFDLVVGITLLLAASPVIAISAIIVKLSSRGPAFFRQDRIGLNGEIITIRKLRTMREDAEELLHTDVKLRQRYLDGDCKVDEASDYRVTSIGRKLRASSFDELPQLWDVVCGRMSLVGPRPALPEQVHCYGEMLPAYQSVRPGLTGAWQVDGRSQVRFPARAFIDFEYITNWTFRRDLQILAMTVPATLGRRGAH